MKLQQNKKLVRNFIFLILLLVCNLLSKLKIENFDFFIDFLKKDAELQDLQLHCIIYLCSLYSNQLDFNEDFFDLILTKFKEWVKKNLFIFLFQKRI